MILVIDEHANGAAERHFVGDLQFDTRSEVHLAKESQVLGIAVTDASDHHHFV